MFILRVLIFLLLFLLHTIYAENTKLCVTIPTHKMVVESLVSKEYHVISLLKPGEKLHGFRYSKSDVIFFSKCKIFFRVLNHYFDDQFIQDLRDYNPEIIVVDLGKYVPLTKKGVYDEFFYRFKTKSDRLQDNEYYWLNPNNLLLQVPKIVEILTTYFPDDQHIFLNKQLSLIKTLENIDLKIISFLNSINTSKVIVFDDAMAYFLHQYGINYYFIPYNKETITSQQIKHIITFAREKKVNVFLSSVNHPSRLIRTLKQPLNGKFIFFDPMNSNYEESLLRLSQQL